jgi:hypothetical protein
VASAERARFHSALWTRFPTHKFPLNLFGPIPVLMAANQAAPGME